MRAALFCLCCAAAQPLAAALPQAALDDVRLAPPPGAALPAGLRFVDQLGKPRTLERVAVPTILIFADYTCRHICGPGVTLTAGALHDAGLVPGRDYRLAVIGLDGDGPAAARAFAASRLATLPAERDAALLLTGSPATVAVAQRAFGYRAVRDPANDQWAHDAASFVLLADGRLSRLLPETAVTPAMMAEALAAARRSEVPGAPERSGFARLVTLCYGFAAAHGLHGAAIVALLRGAAAVTLGGIALALWWLSRRRGQAT